MGHLGQHRGRLLFNQVALQHLSNRLFFVPVSSESLVGGIYWRLTVITNVRIGLMGYVLGSAIFTSKAPLPPFVAISLLNISPINT